MALLVLGLVREPSVPPREFEDLTFLGRPGVDPEVLSAGHWMKVVEMLVDMISRTDDWMSLSVIRLMWPLFTDLSQICSGFEPVAKVERVQGKLAGAHEHCVQRARGSRLSGRLRICAPSSGVGGGNRSTPME